MILSSLKALYNEDLNDILRGTTERFLLNEYELIGLKALIHKFTPALANLPKKKILPVAAYLIKVTFSYKLCRKLQVDILWKAYHL